MRLWGIVLASTLLLTGSAGADDRRSLGDGYDLLVTHQGLFVVKGKQRARLADGVSITKATLDKKARKVDAEIEDYSCDSPHRYTWTVGHLDARLENTSAYALHKKQDYKGAAAGFARAVAADPAWHIPAYNLASAQQLLGDKAAAVATLAPWLAAEPIATYVQVTSDPELAPLLARPELQAIKAKKAGAVTVTAKGIDGGIAYAPERGLIAVDRREASWGASAFTTELEIFDVATGKLVAHTPLIRWDETSNDCYERGCELERAARPVVAKRAKQLQAMLAALGFTTVKLERGSTVRSDEDKHTSQLTRAKLGVVAKGGVARVVHKDTVLGQGAVLEILKEAIYVEALRLAVLWSLRPGAEGCEGTDPTQVTIVKLAAPPAPAK